MSEPQGRQWLCVLRLVDAQDADAPDQRTREIIGAHFDYLSCLREEGRVLLAGRTLDTEPMGLVVYIAPDEHAARAMADADPAVSHGVMRSEVRPYRVALEGFSRGA